MALIRVKARVKGVTGYINCMRGALFGSPYPLNRYSRKESLENYESYLMWRAEDDPIFKQELQKVYIRGQKEDEVKLGCTCNPEDKCHVDILIYFINDLFRNLEV